MSEQIQVSATPAGEVKVQLPAGIVSAIDFQKILDFIKAYGPKIAEALPAILAIISLFSKKSNGKDDELKVG